MSFAARAKQIGIELRDHAPFTFGGALLGIVFMLLFRRAGHVASHVLFGIFHPAHVLLSAMVTAAMFRLHTARQGIIRIILIGYFGSIGVATLSDIIIPHFGAMVFGLDIPTHAEMHRDEQSAASTTAPGESSREHQGIHLGFIEEWYLVNPAAFLGIAIAYVLPRTKAPHSAHVLISTWASSSYLLMDMQSSLTAAAVLASLVTLFLSVWLPCCISDIIFPLLFIGPDAEIGCACPYHAPVRRRTAEVAGGDEE
jgi:hypothetical protein